MDMDTVKREERRMTIERVLFDIRHDLAELRASGLSEWQMNVLNQMIKRIEAPLRTG